ncbi:MAG TPA: hypothetical protein VGL35_07805 [Rhizomicrobium sp.]|jgi:hypothetical protein
MIVARCLAGAACLLSISGYAVFGTTDERPPGGGLIVADEPQAAQIGAAVLMHGGNAADAVTATLLPFR